jgi:hypothetical protein
MRLNLRVKRRERVAEGEGFEPSVGLHLRLISNQVHSTALPPLRIGCHACHGSREYTNRTGAPQAILLNEPYPRSQIVS